MEDCLEGFSEEITKWEIIREMADLDLDEFPNDRIKIIPSVQLLPRQDILIYGIIPKMEQRIFTKCKECRLVFSPRDILSHKTCPGKSQSLYNLKKKVKNKGNKKSHPSLPPPPLFKKPPSPDSTVSSGVVPESATTHPELSKSSMPITTSTQTAMTTTVSIKPEVKSSTHTSKSTSVHSPKVSSKSGVTSEYSPKVSSKTASNSGSSSGSSSISTTNSSSHSINSSRHKKSRKKSSNTKIAKEFDPDSHCGVIEGNKGPCTRSITCSNHRIQLRKLVPGRSKDIHQLIAHRKTAKDKEPKPGSCNSYTSPDRLKESDHFSQNTSHVPLHTAFVSTNEAANKITANVPKIHKMNDFSTHSGQATTLIISVKQPHMTDMESKSSEAMDSNYIMNIQSEESPVGTVPVVYMPMSPISVVNPVQFVQIGKKVICLESPQSAMSPSIMANPKEYFTVPKQSNIKVYKSHPKPAAVPTYSTTKVGGAILMSNHQLTECQRSDLSVAINTKCKTINNYQGYRTISLINHTNSSHRLNIVKIKGVNKVNCKRPAVDKLNNNENKKVRLTPNVNEFLLQSDISESAGAPQSNKSIPDKIALLNMK